MSVAEQTCFAVSRVVLCSCDQIKLCKAKGRRLPNKLCPAVASLVEWLNEGLPSMTTQAEKRKGQYKEGKMSLGMLIFLGYLSVSTICTLLIYAACIAAKRASASEDGEQVVGPRRWQPTGPATGRQGNSTLRSRLA